MKEFLALGIMLLFSAIGILLFIEGCFIPIRKRIAQFSQACGAALDEEPLHTCDPLTPSVSILGVPKNIKPTLSSKMMLLTQC